MRKSVAAMLVLVFLTASCLMLAKPALSSKSEAENTWASKAPMQEARANFGIAVVNEKIYAFGGDSGANVGNAAPPDGISPNTENFTEEYDPASNTWSFKKPMPTARTLFGVAVYRNKVYCIGGYYGVTTRDETMYFNVGVNEVYDPATDTWKSCAAMPSFERFATANVVNGKIYVTSYNLSQAYDPETDSWATKAPPPNEISSPVSAVVDNKIYFIGAQTDSSGVQTGTFVQIYDPSNDNWSVGAESPTSGILTAVGATTGMVALKRIYFFDETETNVYDPASDTWTVGASMLSPRVFARVAVINDACYVVGGRSGQHGYITIMQPSAVNEQYTPFGYGTVPPEIAVVSPENKTYAAGSVSLAFAVNKPVQWLSYSLDGLDNVTIAGNTTLSGLSNGLHNVTVYARDEFENTGASETIIFTVEVPVSFPTVPVVATSAVSIALVGIGLLVYFKKRKR